MKKGLRSVGVTLMTAMLVLSGCSQTPGVTPTLGNVDSLVITHGSGPYEAAAQLAPQAVLRGRSDQRQGVIGTWSSPGFVCRDGTTNAQFFFNVYGQLSGDASFAVRNQTRFDDLIPGSPDRFYNAFLQSFYKSAQFGKFVVNVLASEQNAHFSARGNVPRVLAVPAKIDFGSSTPPVGSRLSIQINTFTNYDIWWYGQYRPDELNSLIQNNDVTVENSGGGAYPLVLESSVHYLPTNEARLYNGFFTNVLVSDCRSTVNNPPILTVPAPISAEATDTLTQVPFQVIASDSDAGDTVRVECVLRREGGADLPVTMTPGAVAGTPATQFTGTVNLAKGDHTVACTAYDSDNVRNLTVVADPNANPPVPGFDGTFQLRVTDNTAPTVNLPAATPRFTAAGTSTTIGVNQLGLSLSDPGPDGVGTDISPALSALSSQTEFPIGLSSVKVSGKDSSVHRTDEMGAWLVPQPGFNQSDEQTMQVQVDFGAARGLKQPVNPDGSSAFKRGSTIPLKFDAPAFAGGAYATGLADGLRLVVKKTAFDAVIMQEPEDLSTGSTVWRYEPATSGAGQYIFNLSTKADTTFFTAGAGYEVFVQYRSASSADYITVAQGSFNLK